MRCRIPHQGALEPWWGLCVCRRLGRTMRIAMLSVHSSPIAQLGGKETGGMNVYVRELSRELGRAIFEVGDVQELTVAEDGATGVVAIGLTGLHRRGLTALEVGGLAVDLTLAVRFGDALVFADRCALRVTDFFGVVVATVIFAAHVAVLLTARHAAPVVVRAFTFGLAVMRAFGATQAFGAWFLDGGALFGAAGRAGLGTAAFGAGGAFALALSFQRRHARGLYRGGFTVRLAVLIANELALGIARQKNATASIQARLCQSRQKHRTEQHARS